MGVSINVTDVATELSQRKEGIGRVAFIFLALGDFFGRVLTVSYCV